MLAGGVTPAIPVAVMKRILVRRGSVDGNASEILSIVTPPRSWTAAGGGDDWLKNPIIAVAGAACAIVNTRLIAPRGRSNCRNGADTAFDGTNVPAIFAIKGVFVGWVGGPSSRIMRDCAGATTRKNTSGENRLNVLAWIRSFTARLS